MVAAANAPEPVILGAAAPASLRESSTKPEQDSHEAEARAARAPWDEIAKLQAAVFEALGGSNQVLVSMLSDGEWSVEGNDLIIKIAQSQTVLDIALGSEAKRLAVAAASGVLKRAMKLKIVPGTVAAQENKRNGATRAAGGPGGRSRAEQDPVVRRMQEKFGAEIRAVIDYREKR
jgi:hypothetical protein